MHNRNQYQRHYESPNKINTFDYPTFKIFECQRRNTHNYETCNSYHQKDDKRRDPYNNYYSSELCSIPNCDNDFCGYSHNQTEVSFHPTLYKTYPCTTTACSLGRFCPFLHPKELTERVRQSQNSEFQNLQQNLLLLDNQIKQEEKVLQDLSIFICSKCHSSASTHTYTCGHLCCSICASLTFCDKCKVQCKSILIKD